MAWTYGDYETQTSDALRLSQLRLHIGEVNAQIHADYAAGGRSYNSAHLTTYLSSVLMPRLKELQSTADSGVDADSVRVSASFTRARPI